ncbi:MAG: PSD1 and planctomycete cytochrome C domain-containing protein [Verrucomicrobia bacterium]|nr:PSD1 and planctomycete cytochrome C domain-containing protein [Verrucomicrobiota bacterium]
MTRLALTVSFAFVWVAAGLADEGIEFFESKVRPLLVESCLECHGGENAKGGLSLETRADWTRGGRSGPAIIPGDPAESPLIRAVKHDGNNGDNGNRPQIPSRNQCGKLSDAEVAVLIEWVRRGAPDPREAAAPIGGMTGEEARAWWSFQPVRPVEPPMTNDAAWPRNEIDRFVLAEMEKHGLNPASGAEKRMLLRRATFDLTGVPPTPEEVESFVNAETDEAFARVVDRLLDSPAYGQRWARHWLDVARYADYHDANPSARTASCEITEAWRYRDWVVSALNADLPFDQFIRHQIAGDLLSSPSGEDFDPAGLVATTFLSNGVWDRGDADKEKIVSDMVDDNIDIVGKAFLGLTLGCARCHDHKFDPISTEDYYALAGMFYSSHILRELGTKGGEYTMNRVPLVPAVAVAKRNEQVERLGELTSKLEALDKQDPKPPEDDPERRLLVARRDQLALELPPEPPLAMAVQEGGTPGGLFPGIQDVPIHIRGSYARLGPVVPRRLPQFFAGDQQPPITSGSGRRELANWVASPDNPLTARVIVNRVWQWHFGEGLVRTPSNFGKLGERPTHPELLDWLAAKFIEDGCSLKRLHRRIMLSATYQQSSRVPRQQVERDQENRWLGRFGAHRLEAEAIRDAVLFVSGELDMVAGGPAGDDFTIPRRSLYVQTARWDRGSYATLFDAANPDSSTEKRTVSTVAPQSLLLLNHPFAHTQARRLADRLLHDAPQDENARIDRAFLLLFSRPASAGEKGMARKLIASGGQSGWADLAHVLLCSNEFVYID